MTASGTGVAQAIAGGVAVSGIVHGDVAVRTEPTARSGYRQQILRIAPDELIGREAELAELAEFCTAPAQGPYAWWRAPAWAGKSALLSWFVLHPPKGMEIVPFFVTARFAAQNDRTAFTEVVSEQLAALLGQPMPAYLTEATREGHLLRMLEEAANTCQERGKRLILVVDGLDEDRGVTTGPDAYSIAALLPAHLPADMRVIVAGRSSPSVPTDVPERHPLRDPDIVRPLPSSSHAAAVRADCERELKRLLHGTSTEQDLLGLVTAAGGGLSRADLTRLTGCSAYDIEQQLHAVTGRTFTARTSHWQPSTGPEVYVLGHEELQTTAVTVLGEGRLSEYRDRLHRWAEQYRDGGWPRSTPEYLLRGYFQMLRATADLPRMVACATDSARQERMLGITGGDSAALTEIVTTQGLILASDVPDLFDMAHLAAHRDILVGRNEYPHHLPAVWAALGQPDRAEALARSMGDTDMVVLALAELAKAVAAANDLDRAAALADTIKSLSSRTALSACWQARRLAAEAEAAGAAGIYDRAAAAARSIDTVIPHATDFSEKAMVLAAQARAVAAYGDHERAGELADTIKDLARTGTVPHWNREAQWAVNSGDPKRIATYVSDLRAIARTIKSPRKQAEVLAKLEETIAASDDHNRESLLMEAVEELARSASPPLWKVEIIQPFTEAVVASSHREHAAQLTDLIRDLAGMIDLPHWKDPVTTRSLSVAAAEALTVACDRNRAAALAGTFQALAGAIQDSTDTETDTEPGAPVLVAAVEAAALSGDYDRAEMLARSITDPYEYPEALTRVAKVVAADGDHGRAAKLAGAAETFCRTTRRPQPQAQALATLAGAVAAVGDRNRAARVADTIEDLIGSAARPYWRAEAQVSLVQAVAAAGDFSRAEALAHAITTPFQRAQALLVLVKALAAEGDLDGAEALARTIADAPDWRRWAGEALAEAAAAVREFDRAETLIRDFADEPQSRARALTRLAGAVAATGDFDRAAALIGPIQDLARTTTDPDVRDIVVQYVGEATALCGRSDDTEDLMHAMADPFRRSQVLNALVEAVAMSGDLGRAAALATRAVELSSSLTAPLEQSQSLTRLVEAVIASGDLGQALSLAERIPLPGWRAVALRSLARVVEPAFGRRLITRTLAMADWEKSLDDLAQLAPSVLPALVDALVGLRKPDTDGTEPGRMSNRPVVGPMDWAGLRNPGV